MTTLPRRSFLYALLALIPALIGGCAGGGSSRSATLIYQTDWTNRGQNVTGLSQRIRVFDAQERLLKAITINQDADGLQQVNLTDLGFGMRHLDVELFSARDLGGIKTGDLDVWIDVNGPVTFLSGVGDTPTQVKTSPNAANLQVDTSKQFYATLYSGPNKATFAAAGTFGWQTLGGVATADANGVVLGTSPGSGSVRATHNPTGFQGGAAIDVEAFQATQSKWTVLVYMNAANDLSPFSMLNMDQMEQVAGVPANVRFVVQWKQTSSLPFSAQFNGTRRYLAKQNVAANQIDSELVQNMGTGVDMGDKQTLNDFVQWGKAHYPADRFVLVIWNHGNGWLNRHPEASSPTRGVSYDDETNNFIRTHELASAIGSHVDIVAWDASLMQMLEVAYEIKDQTDFVVGSEESPPGEGYPYHLIFDDFRDRPDDTTANLTKPFVDGMLAVPAYASRNITQSSLDTTKLDDLVASLNTLAGQLIANKVAITSVVQNVRSPGVTQAYSDSNSLNRHFRDLYHLCLNLENQLPGMPTIVAACADVRAKITAATVWEGHNSHSANSHGIAIDFSSSAQFNANSNATNYALLRLATASLWDEWLGQAP